MTQEYIEIRGARENNLKNVSLRIPKRKITIFTGVSGSGKSSIVFDTIASEARRQLNETFSTFARNFLPRYAQPDADAIENLSMAIVVDQKHLGGGSHSTVGTITDIYSVLRLLYSRVGQPFVGYSNAFSFNDPVAAPMVDSLIERLQHMIDIGLEYLSLNRETDTLSGGESQRIKMVKHLGSSLVDVLYIFDEPSIGLHPRDVHRLNELLQKLRDKGNTVIVVEHDPDVIKVADHVVDVGPHAGNRGGEIVYEGSYDGLLKADTLTGQFMKKSLPI